MSCAWLLRNHYDVTVYERNDYVGGHTNTVLVEEGALQIPVDTGFMVYNEPTYPNLTRLFRELGVETMPTSMSFSVQHIPDGLEFAGNGLNSLFAQRKNLFRLRHYLLLKEINRFNSTCTSILDDPKFQRFSLKQYLDHEKFSDEFRNHYIIPMGSAVWSTPPDRMMQFPAVTLIRFFKNHAFLGLCGQHPWRTVVGGSRMYRNRILADLGDRVRVSCEVTGVRQDGNTTLVTDVAGKTYRHDRVILAAHADESLAILSDPTEEEIKLLSPFRYQENTATLHTDESVMPKTRLSWASWNYRVEEVVGRGDGVASTIYWMNNLQKVSKAKNYFVSINDPGGIDSSKILKQIVYHHPLFDLDAIQAQASLPKLNRRGTRYFCGSYFRYGFHEDALASALDVCALIKGGDPWK